MAGFTFGANPATTNPGSSLTFGSNAPSLSFGTGGGGNPTVAGGSLGGGLAVSAPPPTSTPIPSTAGFTFGVQQQAASQQPGVGVGLTFGAPAPGAGTALNFNKPAAFGTTGGGGSLTFGGGGLQQQVAAVAPSVAATTGLSFFNNPPASASQTTSASAISFGATPQQPAQGGGLSMFGVAATQQQLPTFGAATTTVAAKPTALSFGALPAATTSSGISFGFNAPAKTTATGFSLGMGIGSAPSTGSSLFSGGGLSLAPAVTAVTTAAATTAAAITTAATFKGLGGVDSSTFTNSATGVGAGSRAESKTVKENQVPNDVVQSIESFKDFVKNQKNLSCEVARAPVKPLAKVTEDTTALRQILASLSADLQKNSILADRLKSDTAKGFGQCEMAQRTHDTPAGLQNDNLAPLEFFMNLAAKFEHSVQALRQEIDNTEKHVNTLNQPSMLTPQELSMALRRLHESFVALAGRLQAAHQAVAALKERHLSMRRHFLKDGADIFSGPADFARTASLAKDRSPLGLGARGRGRPSVAGPTPFSSMGAIQALGAITSTHNKSAAGPFGTGTGGSMDAIGHLHHQPGWGVGSTGGTSAVPSLGLGTSHNFAPSGPSLYTFGAPVENQNFQLLKPPPGNKRGKR